MKYCTTYYAMWRVLYPSRVVEYVHLLCQIQMRLHEIRSVGRRVLFCSWCRVLVGGESPEGWMEVGRVKGCGGRGSCQRRWCKWMWGVAEGGKPKTWIVIEGSCQTCFTKRKHLSRMLSVLVSRFLEQYKKRRQNVTDYQPGNQHLLNVLWLLNVFVSEPPTKSKSKTHVLCTQMSERRCVRSRSTVKPMCIGQFRTYLCPNICLLNVKYAAMRKCCLGC